MIKPGKNRLRLRNPLFERIGDMLMGIIFSLFFPWFALVGIRYFLFGVTGPETPDYLVMDMLIILPPAIYLYFQFGRIQTIECKSDSWSRARLKNMIHREFSCEDIKQIEDNLVADIRGREVFLVRKGRQIRIAADSSFHTTSRGKMRLCWPVIGDLRILRKLRRLLEQGPKREYDIKT